MGVNARKVERFQGIQDEILNFLCILRFNALEAGGKTHLSEFCFQPAARYILTQPRIDEGLSKGRGGHAQQNVIQGTQGEIIICICCFAQHPVHSHHTPGI